MTAARILLVESTRAKRASYADSLKRRYDVVSVTSGKQALELEDGGLPDAIVLDAISMRTPGDRVCQQLRRRFPETPLIHLHPGPRPVDENGADSVLLLPFTARKIINSIERLLHEPSESVVTCGPFAVNLARRALMVHGQETHLTPKLTMLVEQFLRHPGETLDRRTLMARVWHTDYLGDTRTLDVHIRWIRRAIEADPGNPHYLKTVRGVGYRLDVPEVALPARTEEAALAV